MKTMYYCIRCFSMRNGAYRLTTRDINAITLAIKLKMVEVKIEKEVCYHCRCGIGDKVANEILLIEKERSLL